MNTVSAPRATRRQLVPFAVLSASYFAHIGFFNPYLPLWLKHLGLSLWMIGLLTSMQAFTRVFAPYIWGWLSDRNGARVPLMRWCAGMALLFSLGLLWHPSPWWLAAVLFGMFIHTSAMMPMSEAAMAHLVSHMGTLDVRRYGRIRLWGSVGFIAAVVGLGLLLDVMPIRFLPLFILTFLILIWLSSLSLTDVGDKKSDGQRENFLRLVLQPTILCFLVASFLLQLSHGPYYTFYTLYLVENYGYSSTASGLLWALGVLAEVGIFIVMHQLLRRFSLRSLMLFSLIVTCGRWLLIGYCADSLALLLFAQLLHACSFGIAHAVSIELVRTHFKGANQGQAQALYSSLSFGAGGAAGALIGGLLWDYSASTTFLLAALSVLVAFIICVFWLRPVHQVGREIHRE